MISGYVHHTGCGIVPRLATTQATILGHQRAAARPEAVWESCIAAGPAETGCRRDGSSEKAFAPRHPVHPPKIWEELAVGHVCAHGSHHTSIHTSWAMRELTNDCHWPMSPRNQHEWLCSTLGGGKRPKPAFPIQISPRSGVEHRVAQNEQDFDSCELLSIQGCLSAVPSGLQIQEPDPSTPGRGIPISGANQVSTRVRLGRKP